MTNTESREIDALVLDFGGVLTVPIHAAFQRWRQLEGIDEDSFIAVMRDWMGAKSGPDTPFKQLETGELAPAELERRLAARLTTVDGGPVEPTRLLKRMFAGMTVEPTMIELVRTARAAGLRTALLSNSWGGGYPMDLLNEICDVIVISGDLGMRKPNPDIYLHTLKLLDLPAPRCLFVDDAEHNVVGARAVGMHGVLHVDTATTTAAVAALVPGLGKEHGGRASGS